MRTMEEEELTTQAKSKRSSTFDQRLKHVLAVEQAAKKELMDVVQRHHADRVGLRQQQMLAFFNDAREAKQVLSRKIAEFRHEHARPIFDASVCSPRFLPDFPDQHFGDWPEGPRFDEFVQTMKILEEYVQIDCTHLRLDWPTITSCPDPMTVGEMYTLIGSKFGDSHGSLYFTLRDGNTRISPDPDILSWSDSAVMFRIPDNVSGLPFHAATTLHLMNAAGDKHDGVNVVLEPRALLYWDSNSISDDGYHWTGSGHKQDVTLKSESLPAEYELFKAPYLTADGLILFSVDNSYIPGVGDPSTVRLIAGPYETGGHLEVQAEVTDDWYWDYTVTARFYIIVPQGYSTAGWQHV